MDMKYALDCADKEISDLRKKLKEVIKENDELKVKLNAEKIGQYYAPVPSKN